MITKSMVILVIFYTLFKCFITELYVNMGKYLNAVEK